MTLLDLVELLTETLGLDLSGDSPDSSRGVYVQDEPYGRVRPVETVEIDQDGDLVIGYAP